MTRTPTGRTYAHAARTRLRAFRRGSILAVALTGAILALWGTPEAVGEPMVPGVPVTEEVLAEEAIAEEVESAESSESGADLMQEPTGAGAEEFRAAEEEAAAPARSLPQERAGAEPIADTIVTDPGESAREATHTLREFAEGFYGMLPRLGIAIALLVLAGVLTRILRPLTRRLLGSWEKGEAASALAGIVVWVIALGVAFSVIAGDVRALIGLAGLVGLALSWSLQAPIESFTGWLLNSFRSYYRIGDRIAVGEVFGDVYKIDFLTTTVWEVGGPEKPVEGEQATGALITFPNSEVLRANIINFTSDFPFVWDEVTINVADESDLDYTARVFREVASRVVGPAMADPAQHYRSLLEAAGFAYDIAVEPWVFFAMTDSFTMATIRYLVPARERRVWSSRLTMALAEEIKRPEHRSRIIAGYPRTQIQIMSEPDQREGPEGRS